MAKREKRTTKKFNLERWLRKSKTSLKEAATKAKDNKGFADYDDGRYKMKAVEASIGPSQSSGRIQVTTTWKFLDGEYKGKKYKSYNGVTDERGNVDTDRVMYFLMDMRRMGYEIDPAEFDVNDIKEILEKIGEDKPIMKCTLRTKGDYQNLMINGPVSEDDDEDEEEEDEDDDNPKKKSKKKDEDDDEDEEDEDEEEDEPKKKSKKKSKDDDDDEDDADEDDEDSDDDEEDEDKPRKKKRGSKSKDEDEDEEEEEEDEDEDEDEDEKPKKKKKKGDDEEDEEEDEDEEEEEEEDGDELAVTVGSVVRCKVKGKKVEAEVTEIFEDDQEVKVKTDEGKTVRIGAGDILEVVDMPKKKRKKK